MFEKKAKMPPFPLTGKPVKGTPKLTVVGMPLPRGAFADPDRDLMPNLLDCNDRNPKKQGVMDFAMAAGLGRTRVGQAYEGFRERYHARVMEKKQRKLERRKTEAATYKEEESTRPQRRKVQPYYSRRGYYQQPQRRRYSRRRTTRRAPEVESVRFKGGGEADLSEIAPERRKKYFHDLMM